MKSLYRVVLAVAVSGMLLCAVACFAQQKSDVKVEMPDRKNIVDSRVIETVGDKGVVNYEEGYIEAVGTGAPPEQYYGKPQARPMALRAAQVDAYRNLLETVQGVQIDSRTTIKDFVVESDTINTAVEGMVKGAQIVKKEYLSDGTVEVTVRMPLSGVAKAILPQAIDDDKKKDMKDHKPVPFSKKPAPKNEVYTGLVVDGRGLSGRPAMSPKIFDENGAEVYGTLIVKKDYAVQQGICGYTRDLAAAQGNVRV
ncbi:MAG: LPP20 family lipoprotein, partial [Syntrophaceae bacterium]|nr:LPP20 family lipoprotein [Syntrophaceae bacterium]